jgi:tetratricopeptide (TPR) repeat protein
LLKDGKDTRLTVEQVQPYLQANGRNAASLVAAFRATGEPALLQEALQKYPNDPRVDFAAVVNKDLSPEERRQWLDAFKKSAPDNALANHLSALDYFNSGKSDQAVQELIVASGKQQFQDYSKDFVENAEEAYLAAGYSAADAKTLSTTGLVLPQLADLKELGLDMVNLAASYRQTGDEASAQATLQIAANLGQGYANASSEQLVCQLVGMQIETRALNAMSPNSSYGETGQAVQDRINQIAQQKAALRDLTQLIGPIMETMSDQDWISFNNRLMIFGEEPAMRWLANKYAAK